MKELSRKLTIERGALEGMLRYMVRRGMIRELHPQCRPKGCRGCRYHGKCPDLPIVGYEVVLSRAESVTSETCGEADGPSYPSD